MSDLHLYVYDLSKGMARRFSAMFLGKHLDGVWHTGIVAYEKEWYFGNDGISCCLPKATILGEPNEIIHLGRTDLNENDFLDVINQLRESTYKIGTYNLMDHNCNNFSNDLSMFLIGKPIPQHIIDLPREVLNSPLGPMLRPLLEQAADPLHQYSAGASSLLPMPLVEHKVGEKKSVQVSPSVILYKQDVTDELKKLLNYIVENKILNDNETNLFMEIQSFMQNEKSKSGISSNHLKLLFDIYFNLIKIEDYQKIVLVLIQNLTLNEEIAEIASKECSFVSVFIPHLEDPKSNDLIKLSLQLISNMSSHKKVSEYLLNEEHQDTLFKHLVNFTHTPLESEIQNDIFESAVSSLYNLISHFHLESLVNDSNALSLGCMLLERLPQVKPKPKTVYHLLSLLRSCLTKSHNVRELALSMDFDITKYSSNLKSNDLVGKSSTEQNGELQSMLNNIDKLVHSENGL